MVQELTTAVHISENICYNKLYVIKRKDEKQWLL